MSLEEGRRTFHKDLSEALVISDHTLIGSVISQAGPVDGKRSDISICLHDVPLKMTGGRFIRAASSPQIQESFMFCSETLYFCFVLTLLLFKRLVSGFTQIPNQICSPHAQI